MTDPLIIAASVALLCLVTVLVLLAGRRSGESASESESRPSLWREIRLFPQALATPRARGDLVAEEDDGVELYLVHARPRKCWTFHAHTETPDEPCDPKQRPHADSGDHREGSGDAGRAETLPPLARGDAPVKIKLRGRGLWKRRYVLEFDGQPWLELEAPRRSDDGFRLQLANSGQSLNVQGRPADGEYEIRRADRLAALVARIDLRDAPGVGNGNGEGGNGEGGNGEGGNGEGDDPGAGTDATRSRAPCEWSLQVRRQEDVTRITALALAVAALDLDAERSRT